MAQDMGDSVAPSVDNSSSWNPAFRPEAIDAGNNYPDSNAAETPSGPEMEGSSATMDTSSMAAPEDSQFASDADFFFREKLNASSSFDTQTPTVPNTPESNFRADVDHVSNTVGRNGTWSIRNEEGQTAQTVVQPPTGDDFAPADQAMPSEKPDVKPTENYPTHEDMSTLPSDKGEVQEPQFGGSVLRAENDENVMTNGEADTNGRGPWENAESAGDAGEEDFFNQLNAQTKPIYSPPDPDARFEEGMPLLDDVVQSPQQLDQPAANTNSQIDKIFGEDGDSEDGFFSNLQNSAREEKEPSHIARKSTTQVIGNSAMGPDSPVSEMPPGFGQQDGGHTAPQAPENAQNQAPSEEELAARWMAELDDDDMLLPDETGEASVENQNQNQAPVPQSVPDFSNDSSVANGLNSPFVSPPRKQPLPYTPHQPSTSDLLQEPLDGVSPASTVPASSYFAPQPNTPTLRKAQSFVEQPKQGYKSPYDLPEDLTLPRRPHKPAAPKVAALPFPAQSGSIPAPPPVSASPSMSASVPPPAAAPPKNFYEELPPPPQRSRPSSSGRYTPGSNASAPGLYQRPPPPVVAPPHQFTSAPSQQPAAVPPPKNFFEELPPPPQRSRPSSSGRYTPGSNASVPVPGPYQRPPPAVSAPQHQAASAPPPPPATVPPPKNFFEELPPPPQGSRPSSSGRYTPGSNASIPGPYQQPPPPPKNQFASAPPPASSGRYTPDRKPSVPTPPATSFPYASSPSPGQRSGDSYFQPQLEQPEKMNPYANPSAPSAPTAPSAPSRYSPKPPGLQVGSKPPSISRYSPAPPPPSSSAPVARNYQPSTPPGSVNLTGPLPFQPRASSPLAYHEDAEYQTEEPRAPPLNPTVNLSPPRSVPQPPVSRGSLQAPSLSLNSFDSDVAGAVNGDVAFPPVGQQQTSPPKNPYAPQPRANSISARGRSGLNPSSTLTAYGPSTIAAPFSPPRRSRTQSPSRQMAGPRLSVPSIDPLQRPASANGPGSPTKNIINPYQTPQATISARVLTQHLDFVLPDEDQQLDPLERWKGVPIVDFGFGGDIVSCFPKHVPRYMSGQATPKVKPTPGEVKVHRLNEWLPAGESVISYPGPLRTKSKKKDIVAWLFSRIAAFENEGLSESAQLHPEPYKRQEEKILLWKIVKVLVENDGKLEGSVDIQKSVRNVLFPDLPNTEAFQPYGDGLTASNGLDAQFRPDSVDPQFADSLRINLLNGDREKAVWSAADNRMWGHAMILASTLDKSVWKQVVQEFVRREIRSTSRNAESLAALYEIFAGNIEESIDELVPPSVRAGLQMVSKDSAHGPTKNALDGLDSWKDTVQLVLSNQSPDGPQALVALGRLLSTYGRTEAAHICYLFSRVSVFGGADDPLAGIVLLGVDHRGNSNALLDEDAIQLTEVYEYATCVLAGSPAATMPHLLAFKLIYAKSLAEHGRKSEALQYCDAIASTLKAATRPSGYYHQHLFSEIDELSARLKQTTSDGVSSWLPRPSMEKVSGSMWAKFSSFVAGEDSDAASTGSGKAGETADVGPFARVTGTPTISRSPSVSDMYGSHLSAAAPPMTNGASRYHPGHQYAPNGSPDHYHPRSSLDSQRSAGSFGYPYGQRRGSQEPPMASEGGPYHPGPFYSSSPAAGHRFSPPQTSYMPLAPVEEDRTYQTQPMPASVPPPTYPPQHFGSLEQGSGVQTSQYGYVPPASTSGYEPPPSTIAVAENTDVSDVETRLGKSSMDEDDGAVRAEAMRKAEREQADREADEAFRRAAEADGMLFRVILYHASFLLT